jgi:hypothetical protein
VRHRADAQVPDGPLQPFVLAMPEEYYGPRTLFCTKCAMYCEDEVKRERCAECEYPRWSCHHAIYAYRAYYRTEKRGYWRQPRDPAKPSVWVPAKWTKRDPPEWF